jgi:hypothetical protein
MHDFTFASFAAASNEEPLPVAIEAAKAPAAEPCTKLRRETEGIMIDHPM